MATLGRRLRCIATGLDGDHAGCGASKPLSLSGVVPAASAARAETLALSRPEPGRSTAHAPWELVTSDPGWQARDSQGEVAFDGKLWLLGGWFESFDAPPRDVWSSSTGASWEKVTGTAAWKHSDFPMTAAFKDRIFIMGGWTNGRLPDHSASNEVWASVPPNLR